MLDIKAKHASCQGKTCFMSRNHVEIRAWHARARAFMPLCKSVFKSVVKSVFESVCKSVFQSVFKSIFQRVFNSDVWHDTGRYEQDMRGRVDACRAVTSFTKILAAFPQVSISAFGVQGFGFGV